MKNRIENGVLIIAGKFKTVNLKITEEAPARMGFGRRDNFDLKRISVEKAEQLVKDGFKFLERIETSKAELQSLTEEQKNPSKPKK
ncbi:hypothetical protein V9L05_15235 [Bernardetia sp. Wsw4-3y2]|uniref:hypothetical protein n=1 Tax=Bernardetia sp. Wsw4-3y2 TaxID=3127471 RepID=UPI0030D3FDD7